MFGMAGRSDFNARKNSDAKAVAGCSPEHEQILVETPEQTLQAIARIKGHFIEVERTMRLEKEPKKNANAVALGRLGGLKSGKVRRAQSALAEKKSGTVKRSA
jgi:hypothetical protein